MKVVLYMAMTVNGIIASEKGNTSWVTKTEWKNFTKMIQQAGNMVIGRRTYEIMAKNDEFNQSKLNEVKTVVVTHKHLKIHNPKFVVSVSSAKDALDILKKQGFRTIIVCGGGKLNSSFMVDDLIDEIYLDIEPVVLGKGIKLFADADFERKMEFIGIKKLSTNEIQLHYRVKK